MSARKYTETKTVLMTKRQSEGINDLNAATRIPKAELIRQGIDLVLAKYAQMKQANKAQG